MPTIPAPLYALVGATDIATAKARELPEKLAELELRRFELPKVDSAKLDPRHLELPKVDAAKLDPRHLDLSKVQIPKVEMSFDMPKLELPNIEMSDVASFALELAAKAEKTYDELVVRGEQVVARVRGTEHVTAPAAAPVAAGPAKPATRKPTAKKATKKPAKTAAPTAPGPEA